MCIGRFQPLQGRHAALVTPLRGHFDRIYLACTGSDLPRDTGNPWSLRERVTALAAVFPAPACQVLPVADCWYDDQRWANAVTATVHAACVREGLGSPASVSCLGLERQGAAYYARLFPGWTILEPAPDAPAFVQALGEDLLQADARGRAACAAAHVPAAALALVEALAGSPTGEALLAEQAFIRDYRAAWNRAPYPPMFITVDTLALWRGQVLLVQRGHRPGKGLLALPGGFLDVNETLADAARRELVEETGLILDAHAVAGSGTVFDHPLRSRRGRTVTHVFCFNLDQHPQPPQVAGGDDAADARWWPLATLKASQCFEDHYAILQQMVGLP